MTGSTREARYAGTSPVIAPTSVSVASATAKETGSIADTPCSWLAATRVKSRLWAIALGLLLGGVLGNLTDRMFREPGFPVGHVIDFINTPWMMPAIYNIADIFIVLMMIGVALLVLVGLHLDGTREARRTTATDAGTGSGESAGGAAGDGEADAAASGSSKD